MTLLEFGTPLNQRGVKSARAQGALKPQNAQKAYDSLAGSAMMRRAGKASGAPLRGDQAAALLAARRAKDAQDQLGRQLKEYYHAMLSEPAPARLTALVEALAAQQPG
jgi:glycerol-3-phosphate O-acyltransferase